MVIITMPTKQLSKNTKITSIQQFVSKIDGTIYSMSHSVLACTVAGLKWGKIAAQDK